MKLSACGSSLLDSKDGSLLDFSDELGAYAELEEHSRSRSTFVNLHDTGLYTSLGEGTKMSVPVAVWHRFMESIAGGMSRGGSVQSAGIPSDN